MFSIIGFLILGLLSCQKADELEFDSLDSYFLAATNEVIINGDEISFYDDSNSGNLITLRRGTERVVSLYASYTTLWYETGGEVVATIGGNNAIELYEYYIGRNILTTDKVEIVANNSAGSSFSIEKIFSYNPELVIASNAMNGYQSVAKALKTADIPVIALDYNNFSDYLKWFKVFSFLNNQEELFETVALKALTNIKNTIINVRNNSDCEVLTLFPNASGPTACTAETLVGRMLLELGATNIIKTTSDADKVPINLETIVAKDPDIILINCHNTKAEAQEIIEKYYSNMPLWQSLTAVKEGKVFYLDKMLFHNKPNKLFAKAYATLGQIIAEYK